MNIRREVLYVLIAAAVVILGWIIYAGISTSPS